MSQFQNTDQSIYAAAAAGGVILSKVPGYGTDRIQITRIDSKGRPVLKDLEGSAIQQAFKSSKFHWDGKTPLAKTLQAASFNNHGSDPNAGSKPTYKNVTVTGISWTPPPPIDRSPAKAGGAAAKGKAPATKRKVGGLSLEGPTLDELMAKKAKLTAMHARLQVLEATLQAGMDKVDPTKAKKSPAASPAKAPAKAPASPGGAGPSKAPVNLMLYNNFTGGKATVSQHYAAVAETSPAKSWSAKQMRSTLLSDHYSNEQLRQLADGAGIDARIKKPEILRKKLGEHFAEIL